MFEILSLRVNPSDCTQSDFGSDFEKFPDNSKAIASTELWKLVLKEDENLWGDEMLEQR